jgi:hypothetical protein
MKTSQIKDDLEYRVDLAKPVMRGPFKMLPRDKHTMKGEALREIVEEHGWEVIADVGPAA